jgi:maltose O-acetyltransferase
LVNVVAASGLMPNRVRLALYRLASISVGTSTIMSGAYISHPNLTIGDRCFINQGCLFDPLADIVLEDRVYLAPRVSIITGTHAIGGPDQRASTNVSEPIRIGAGSWLCANVTVLPGVTVAPGCIIAAGAVVVEDTEPDGLYAGLPARRIRDLDTNATGRSLAA